MKNLYICFYCDQQFSDPMKLRLHYIEHKSLKSSQVKNALSKLRKYELVKVDVTDVSCKLCDETILDFPSLKWHLLNKHKKNLDPKSADGVLPFKVTLDEFQCVLCVEKYAEFKSLNQHMNVHFQNFICEQCGTGFVTPERLRTHAFSHETGCFPCDSCDKIFRSTNAKNEHYATVHMKVKRHRCPQCPETFRNYFQRNKHISSIHGVKLKEFKCTMCPKVFTLSGKLGVHVRTVHLKMKRHSCDVCEWKFYSKSELKEHMIRHGGERKFQCGVCKKAYARKHTLREHMRIHDNDRRFICATCGTSFVQKCSLKHHAKIHHPSLGQRTNSPIPETKRRIVPLFQVAYDRSLCRPLGTLVNFSALKKTFKTVIKDLTPSRSPSPVYMPRSPSLLVERPKSVGTVQPKAKKNPDIRQNALAVFEFSTIYPFVYGNNKFKCFVCSQPFLDLHLLKEHMRDTHTFAPLKRLVNNRRENVLKVDVSDITCKICPEKPADLVGLKRHLKEIHDKPINLNLQDNLIPFKLEMVDGSYRCVICEQTFIKVRILVIHMSVHFNNYSCEICGSGFMTLRLMKKHLEVHETGNYPCDRCNKVFSTSYKRTLHVRGVHLKQYPRRCPICPERFNSNYKRTIHLQDVHNQSTRVHKCETCGRGFNLKYHLICHTRSVHLQERNQQCEVCQQRFCNKESLKRHMVIHTGEKNHKCDVCGMAFLRRKNLKDHLRLHNIE